MKLPACWAIARTIAITRDANDIARYARKLDVGRLEQLQQN
jgi:hypothetical protein